MATSTGFNPFQFLQKQPIATQGTPAAPAPAANGQPAAPGTNGLPAAPNPAAGVGADGQPLPAAGATGAGTGSPLDAFTEFFTIDPKKQPTVDPLGEKLFNLDPKKLSETAGKLDFTRVLKPELVQKALAGDIASFNQVINQVMQSVFMMTMQTNVNMMEGGFNKNNERFSSVLDGKFRDYQVNTSSTQNPALRHPAVQPVLAAIRSQIAQSNPNMPPSEVASKAEEYFLATSTAINSLNQDTMRGGAGGTAKEPDFSVFLGLDTVNPNT